MSTHRLPLHRSIPVIATRAVILTGCSMGVSSEPTENADINEVVWEEGNPDIEDSSGGSTLLPAGFAQ
ncbi:hypothetical protein ACFSYH_13675 [Populibacterium corticicola]|uniref:Uncharacterized protein n=1 Tax=Populibacterium corticicola TaxID=1812826 RepID=A0ABW5XGL8_9MICO